MPKSNCINKPLPAAVRLLRTKSDTVRLLARPHTSRAPAALHTGGAVAAHAESHLTRPMAFVMESKLQRGASVTLIGNCAALGDWAVETGVPLAQLNGSTFGVVVDLPTDQDVEYKFVVQKEGECMLVSGFGCIERGLLGGISYALGLVRALYAELDLFSQGRYGPSGSQV